MKIVKSSPEQSLCKRLGLVALQCLTVAAVQATPYATCLTNSAGVISFRLNEAADGVKIISSGGTVTNDLGALGPGVTVTNLGITGVFKIEVTKASGAGWMQGAALLVSSDSNRALQFEQPVGVAVNRDPASPYFGRIYVSNARSIMTTSGRTATEGIYVLSSDLADELGQGDTGLTAGINTFDSATYDSTSPWRVSVGEDENLYISDFNPNTGTIWVTDPNVSDFSGQNVLEGLGTFATYHGQIPSSPVVTGSLADTNLTVYTLDADYFYNNGLHRFDVGGGPLPSSANFVDLTGPSGPLSQTPPGGIVGMDRAADGKFYLTQYSDTGNQPGLVVLSNQETNEDGSLVTLYKSLDDWRTLSGNSNAVDCLLHIYAVKISPLSNYLALPTIDGPTFIVPLDTNGLPVLTNRMTINTATGVTGDVSFDAAGNLYIVNSTMQLVRVFSAGGHSVAITGSDGTFASGYEPAPPVTDTNVTILDIDVNGNNVIIDFTSPSSGPFSVLSSAAVNGQYATDASAVIVSTGGNTYRATTTASGVTRFYRIAQQGGTPPDNTISIVSFQVSGTNALIDFRTSLAGPFSVTTSAAVTGPYTADTSATVVPTGANLYRATSATVSGPMRFFRVGRTQ